MELSHYFTEGSISDALIVVPRSWTPVPPQWATKVMNRATADPRVPAGDQHGGEWTSEGDGGSSSEPTNGSRPSGDSRPVQYAALETGTQTDESHAPAGVQYASATPPDISGALTGNSRTDEVTKKLAQIYADTMEALARVPGQPQKYGIFVHAAFATAVTEAGIREHMDIERSFALPPGFPSSKRTVRPDIVLRNDSGDVVAIYDIKTGDAGIDPWRARELRAATGAGPDVPIIVMYTDEAISKIQTICPARVAQMAMQICVLCDQLLDSIAEWQRSIDAEGFPLRLSDADPTRNLSAYLCDEETSIEYDVHGFSELKDAYGNVNFGGNWKYAIAFTWSSDFAEEIAAWMAATAYVRATNGVIFDEQESKVVTPTVSLKIAHDIKQRRPALEAMLRDYIDQLAAKSPESSAAIERFMQRRSLRAD